MAASWYFQIMGDVQGPVTSQQLKRLAEIGNIDFETLVRRGEDGNWVSAEQVQGLFNRSPVAVVAPPPAPPPLQTAVPHEGNGHPARPASGLSAKKTPANKRQTLGQKLVYFFDPMFDRYLTPWIIRVTWVLLLAMAGLSAAVFGYGHVAVLSALEPDLGDVQRAEFELMKAESFLREMEEIRGVRRRPGNSRRQTASDVARPVPATQEAPRSQDPLADEKERVAQARAALERAKASVPSRSQMIVEHLPMMVLLYSLQLAAGILAVLWLRVLLEGGIVLFNIVSKLGSIDERLASMGGGNLPGGSRD